ncbi:MAG: folate-binding protein YgfZ [Pseudomonadota bacterium]|nr:folate-binding protein YgfZ [Pseudomonadota bacterium]
MDIPPVSGPAHHDQDSCLFEPAPAQPELPGLAWCDLDDRDLLRVEGSEAETFLQGQLTQDMTRLREARMLLAAHCSPKGRATALFRVWRLDDSFLLDLPAGMGAAARRRLAMYVLRAKATVHDARPDWETTGVAGSAAAALLQAGGLAVPREAGALTHSAAVVCICLGPSRWLVHSARGEDGGLRARLAACSDPDRSGWLLACLRDGDPEVLPQTIDAFVPQMLNLDTLDGISFKKGCYTGQEIVARTHFLGRVKRRMRRFGYRGAQPPAPGSQVALCGPVAFPASGATDETAGAHALVVWSLATHEGGGEALAVASVAVDA